MVTTYNSQQKHHSLNIDFHKCFDIIPAKPLFLTSKDKSFYQEQMKSGDGYNMLKLVSLHPSKISSQNISTNNISVNKCESFSECDSSPTVEEEQFNPENVCQRKCKCAAVDVAEISLKGNSSTY